MRKPYDRKSNSMEKRQFLVLYRSFLMRVIDLELLSADADTARLLGQFAALFAGLSYMFTVWLIFAGGFSKAFLWVMEHFLIATTMVVVSLFSVLCWDSIFPDKREVLVLAPLPIRAHYAVPRETGCPDCGIERVSGFAERLLRTGVAFSIFCHERRRVFRCDPVAGRVLDHDGAGWIVYVLLRAWSSGCDLAGVAAAAVFASVGVVAGWRIFRFLWRVHSRTFAGDA